jgi:O-antigen/teichoic acid export membrane protein
MIGFSVWILFGASANAAETKISEIIINLFFGTLTNAGFAISTNINIVLKHFAESLNKAVIPQITKSYSSGNPNRTIELVIFSSKYSFFLMLLPAVPLLLETKYILELWLKDVPPYTIIFVQLMIINSMIEVMNAGIPAAVHATGKIKYFQLVLSIIKLLALPAAYFLLRTGSEPYMIIIAFTVSALVNLFVQQILLKELIQFKVKEFVTQAYLKMLYVLFPISSLFFIQQMFTPGIHRFFGCSIVSALFILLMVYAVGISNSERVYFKNYITNKFLKKST